MSIIVTLTTIPARLHNTLYNKDIKLCIDALLNFNHNNYEIHFNIPKTYKQTGEAYIIPDWLKKQSEKHLFFKIFRTKDYGSATKLIPTVERVSDPNTIIISLDDDMVYHPELINEHVNNQKTWPDYAVGYDGMRSRNSDGSFANFFQDSRDYYFSSTGRNSLVDILQAYKSISYKRSFFKDDFLDFMINQGTWCDDTSISAYLSKNKIGRLCTFFKGDKFHEKYDDWINNLRQTFPIISHTEHDPQDGCNLSRQKFAEDQDVVQKTTELYQNYIDKGYIRDQTWEV